MPPESDRDVEDLLSDVLDGRPAENRDRSRAYAAAGQAPVDLQDTDYSASIRQAEPPSPPEAQSEIEEPTRDEESARSRGPASDNTASSANLDPAAEHAAEPGLEEAARTLSHSHLGETAASNAERKIRRPILSVRTPVEAAEARVPFVQRVVFEQYGQRDWTIFEQYARDARIERLEIQDPYCCADEQARGRLINFIGRFEQLASEIAAVQIVTFDADSVQTRDPESTRDQRQDLEDRWNRMLASVPLHLAQKSRRSGGDLHDRFVRAKLENGDTVIWDLGRGIDGVMNARWSCVVNAFYEGSISSSRAMH